MPTKTSPNRLLQSADVAIISIFVLGFVFSPLGAWTGAVLCAWFIGTQKAWRGFLLLAAINFILRLPSNWHRSQLAGIEYAGWTILAVLISVLPFLLYRLASQRRQGFLSTLSLPLWGVALQILGQLFFPARIFNPYSSFLIYWFAAVINWMWSQEFQAKKIAAGAGIFGAACILVLGSVLSGKSLADRSNCMSLRG